MFGIRAVLASFAGIAIAAAAVITCSITPPAGAANATTVEAESIKASPPSAGRKVRDSTASGGVALLLRSVATATTTVALPASASVVVRAKGRPCFGAPTMAILVDGKAIYTTKVSETSYTDYTISTTISAGSHSIGVAYPDPYRTFLCTRTLAVDTLSVVASAPPTTSTTTPTTTTTTTTTTPTTTTTTPTTTATTTTTTTSPTSTSTTTTTSSPPPPSGDTTDWLQSRFDALQPGDTLTLDPRTYQHSGVLKVRVEGVRLEGNGATLQATKDETSALQILADDVSVADLNLSAPLTGSRYSTPQQHKLVIQSKGVTVSDVNITGSAAAGVFIYGASDFTLDRVTVRNTRADGIHMTNGASNGQVNNAVTEWTGDDGVAVVSYGGEPICHDIIVNSPTVNGTTHGRGITVVGGRNISYRNVKVTQSDAAGVYIASEGAPYYTLPVSNVDVTGGTVTGANTSTQVVHGAVLVYSGNTNSGLSDVTISGLTIANTPTSAQRNVGIILDNGTLRRIAFNDIALLNTSLPPFITSAKVPEDSYTTSRWTLDGSPITVP